MIRCKAFRYLITLSLTVCVLVFAAACDSKSVRDGGNVEDPDGLRSKDGDYPEKVVLQADELVIWWDMAFGVPYDSFAKDPLTGQFPDTKFEFVEFLPPFYTIGDDLFKMVRDRPSPDLIVFDKRYLPLLVEAEYLEPIPDLFALEIEYDEVTDLRSYAPDGQLYALPFGRNIPGLFYNKAAFDELDLPYPTNGMTWDEVADLVARLMPGHRDPIDIADYDLLVSQLGTDIYDSETGKLNTETDEWKALLQLLIEISVHDKERNSSISSFAAGDTAIAVGTLFGNPTVIKDLYNKLSTMEVLDVDWDVVSFPLFNGVMPAEDTLLIGIPSRSGYKDDVLEVIRFLMSKGVQSENMAKGLLSVRADADSWTEDFGSASKWLAGKAFPSLITSLKRTKAALPDRDLEIRSMVSLESIRTNDIIYTVDEWIDIAQNKIKEGLDKYYQERSRLIGELKTRF